MANETDASGDRGRALSGFLAAKVSEGYRVETHESTHAIIVQGDGAGWQRLLRRGRNRFVVEVDDHGAVSMSPAEPLRH